MSPPLDDNGQISTHTEVPAAPLKRLQEEDCGVAKNIKPTLNKRRR